MKSHQCKMLNGSLFPTQVSSIFTSVLDVLNVGVSIYMKRKMGSGFYTPHPWAVIIQLNLTVITAVKILTFSGSTLSNSLRTRVHLSWILVMVISAADP